MTGNTRLIPQSTSQLHAAVEGGIGWIVFNNPARRNAMSLDMWGALGQAASALEQDPEVRVLVLRGAGGRAFVSGDDVSEFSTLRATTEQKEHYTETVQRSYQLLARVNKPVVALLEGACIGAGLIIALMADVRLAKNGSIFGIPAAKVGVGCEYEGVSLLSRLVGPSVAKDILFTGRYLECPEAARIGLINQVWDREDFESEAQGYIKTLLVNAPLTLHCVKHAIRVFEGYSQTKKDVEVRALSAACFDSLDYEEGLRAFSEKRAPVFRGR